MIDIKLRNVGGFGDAIHGARNSFRSWGRGDSTYEIDQTDGEKWYIGDKDLTLLLSLRKRSSSEAKPMRVISVSIDVTAPLYFWKEFDTYKIGTVGMSESTMHSICDKEFELSDFSHEHLGDIDISFGRQKTPCMFDTKEPLKSTIHYLNLYRKGYLYYKEMRNSYVKGLDTNCNLTFNQIVDNMELMWWQIIQTLPSSYNQHRTEVLNYEVLSAQYWDRRNHKLDEWRDYCKWIESLPYAKELIIGNDNV